MTGRRRCVALLGAVATAVALLAGCAPAGGGASPSPQDDSGVHWGELGDYFEPVEDEPNGLVGDYENEGGPEPRPAQYVVQELIRQPERQSCPFLVHLAHQLGDNWGTVDLCVADRDWYAQREGQLYQPVTDAGRDQYASIGGW